MKPGLSWRGAVAALCVGLLGVSAWQGRPGEAPPAGAVAGAARPDADEALAARGAYLARVGNCAGCHSMPGAAAYAGGRGIPTPFGMVFAGNLTPDDETGLGRWSADDFWRALHEGRGRDGRRLVPAFPYTSYTHLARDDADAIFAYLRRLPAVRQPPRPHALRFPYGTPWALAAWQWAFFRPDAAAPQRAPEGGLARGRYLVEGLGHCGACHAPRGRWGAPADNLGGGEIPAQAWVAPSLHPDGRQPVSAAELVALLRTGRNARGSASGPMAAVVYTSTRHWSDADLAAAAAYLLSLPPQPGPAAPAETAAAADTAGRQLYDDRCAECHGDQGQGAEGAYPALAGNATVLQDDPRNLLLVMRRGAFGPVTAARPRPYGMPPQDMSDAELAAVASHVRQAWGNAAGPVSELQALRSR
ncbi:MAG: cytochrome c [Burkholderiaceae bacterium]